MIEIINQLKELRYFRFLVKSWTVREIKIRYKQSVLGGLWAVLQPLSIALIFSLIFSYFIVVPTNGIPHIIFYYSVLFPWTFFSNSVTQGANSLVNNQNLITKIYFPREILPIGSIISSLFDLGIALIVYMGLAVLYKVQFGVPLLLLPVLIILELLFTAPVVFILAALNVFYRDIRFVIPLALQIFMYTVPLIYPLSVVPEAFQKIYMLNPMAGLLYSFRSILVYNQWPNPVYLISSAVLSLILFVVGYAYFIRAARKFADVI